MEETNAIFGGFDRDGGDECKSNLAGSAAFARDVKPGSDVHSIIPNQRSPLENKGYHVVNILHLTVYDDCLLTARVERRSGGSLDSLSCCAIARLVWHGEVHWNPSDKTTTATPGSGIFHLKVQTPEVYEFQYNGKHRFGMRLPLMRNQLPTTSTPHHLLIPPHAFAAYAEPTPNNQHTAVSIAIKTPKRCNAYQIDVFHCIGTRKPLEFEL